MPCTQPLNVRFNTSTIAGLRESERVQQQVRGLRHRRHDGGHGAPLPLLSTNLGSDLDALGGPHTGPAEFHYEKIIQRAYSFPFAVRSRTSFKTSSSTCGMDRAVESTYTASGACIS